MATSIVALFVYIFGAYAYGYLLFLWDRQRHFGLSEAATAEDRRLSAAGWRLFAACAIWFVLHSIIEFRSLLGEPKFDDTLDLATLILVYLFPAIIFHSYLLRTLADVGISRPPRRWSLVLWGFYAAGLSLIAFFLAAIFGRIPAPQPLGRWIGVSIGAQFTLMSVASMIVRRTHPRRDATTDQRRLGSAVDRLFIGMIAVFILINVWQAEALMLLARATPLVFLLVSIYYESRIEFYDLVVKRGVLLVMSLVLTGAVLALSLNSLTAIPEGPARPWIFAVYLLPVAMFIPWLHDRVGRLLDRWWFGREFTPVEAIKHVLAAMQQAADEPALVAATQATLSEMFRRRIVIVGDGDAIPDRAGVAIDIRTLDSDVPIRLAVVNEPGTRAMLSEDVALLRSLGGVYSYMLENVRLQRKRQEQEQVAQQLRLQTSRSELKALRAQINPHFLFNALNAIASLIHTDPARADAAVEQLAEVFRYTLRRSEQEWAPLDQELAFARAYLEVEQARFGKRLTFTIHTDDMVSSTQVPAMLLQTLVENAVKHGIARLRTPGRIDIRATQTNGRVTLEVRDTGPGPSHPANLTTSGASFGLRSVRDRLHGHFGAQARLELTREHDTTVARIEMPLTEDLSSTTGAVR